MLKKSIDFIMETNTLILVSRNYKVSFANQIIQTFNFLVASSILLLLGAQISYTVKLNFITNMPIFSFVSRFIIDCIFFTAHTSSFCEFLSSFGVNY